MAKRAVVPVSPELLAAVLADPADDVARHVYADALLERGDPRGELIAVQLALAAAGNRSTPKTKALWGRFRALHSAHAAKWAKPLRALGKRARWEFHRGFVRQLRLAEPTDALGAVLAIEPVTHLVIEYASVMWLKKALALPGMARLARLCIMSTEVGYQVRLATALATAKLPVLVELRVGLWSDKAVVAFAEKCTLPALRHLALGCGGHHQVLRAKGLAKLARSKVGGRLTTLELGRCDLEPDMRRIVLAMKKLERFSATKGNVLGDDDPADNAAALAALRARFGAGFVSEDETSFDYLLDGVAGLSKVTLSRAGRS